MGRTITFLHTADLHLGAPVRGFRDLSPAWRERLVRAIPEAFERLIETALERRVDFVVIAGDSFDTSGPSYGDFLHFFEGLQRLSNVGIPVYLTTGNHDPYSSWKDYVGKLPAGCFMLGAEGPQFALFERDGQPLCLIGARGYRNQAWPIDEPIARGINRENARAALAAERPDAARAPFCIGVIHTGLDIDQSKAYADPQSLIGADVDYWACGHLHKHLVQPTQASPRLAFPGCIQGRDLKESGERGCFVVTLEECEQGSVGPSSVSLEFVRTASVVFATVKVDVSACQTLADVVRLVQAELFRENGKTGCDEMAERVILEGQTDLHEYLRKEDVIRDLRKRINAAYPSFYCDALVDRTRSLRDDAALANAGTFGSFALRAARQQRETGAASVAYVQGELVKRGIEVPAALGRRIADFQDAAQVLVFDLLEGEGR